MSSKKRRKLSPLEGDRKRVMADDSTEPNGLNTAIPLRGYVQSAAQWDLEQDYENRPRKLKGKKDNTRLPIKTEDGRLQPVNRVEVDAIDNDSLLDSQSDEPGSEVDGEVAVDAAVDARPAKVIILEAKEEMARIARLINQDPEEYVGRMKDLAELANSPVVAVRKLALATQMAIFKDVIPGYKIRQLSDEDMREKVSKEVRRIRAFEQNLLGSYRTYIDTLSALTKEHHIKGSELAELSQVALSCVCTLATSVSHFNFYTELLKVLLSKVSRPKVNNAHARCVATLERLFQDDEECLASQEAVSLLTKMMKQHNYNIDESLLNTFLHLRLLNEFAFKASMSSVDGDLSKPKGKKLRPTREFRTKRQRKALKEMKAAEKEFEQADASVQREARDRAQAETLKLVFGAYFRVLKTRKPRLMGAVLEGLARYAHLVNQEFFGDLLVTLGELANEAVRGLEGGDEARSSFDDSEDDPSEELGSLEGSTTQLRSALLCTTTAFALLSSQEANSLNLDLSSFASTLYTLALHLSLAPDLELTTKSARLPENSHAKVHATALSTLLLRALTSSLTPRHTPPMRLAAFTHRLMLASLHVPEKTTRAMLALIEELATHQGRKIRGLWGTDEQRGDGRFEPLLGIEACRPFCGTIWEGELLRRHYADTVRSQLGDLEKVVKNFA